HAHVIVTSGEDGAFDLWFGGLVSPHRIDSDDGWHEREDCTRSSRQRKLTDLGQIWGWGLVSAAPPALLHGPCSSHTWRRRDAAASSRGSSGTRSGQWR